MVVTGLALALRLPGARYGLPHFVHPDESILVPLAVQFLTGDLNPHFFNWPTAYMYVLSALYAAGGALLAGDGGHATVMAFVRDPTPFYLVGRVVSGLLGATTVLLTYALGARVAGPAVGFAASLFLAFNLQHVVDSHFATTDVPVTAAILGALLATLRYWERGRASDGLLAGFLGGLAASTKYNGGLVGIAFLTAHILRARAAGGGIQWRLAAGVVPGWLGAAAVGFVAGTPFAVLSPREFSRGLFGELQAIGTPQFGNEADPPGLLFHLLHALPQAMGVPLLGAATLGLVVLLRRRAPLDLIVLAFPLPYLVIIGTWGSRFERYAEPVFPFACVLAALGLWELASRWPARRVVVVSALAALATLPVLGRVLYYEVLLWRPDSREVAAAWIEKNLPADAQIAMEPYTPSVTWRDETGAVHRVTSPPLDGASGVVRGLQRYRPTASRMTGPRVVPLVAYDLDALRARGVGYVVLSGFMYRRYLESCDRFPAACRFYRELDQAAKLVFVERPVPEAQRLWVGDIYAPVSAVFARTRPGPIIKVYQLDGEPRR
jgi:hypothetical protein